MRGEPSGDAPPMPRLIRAAAIVHPVPSALNALVVAALALVAGAVPAVAIALATAMFAFQAAIGAVNDIVDAEVDRLVKRGKPIPAGTIDARAAAAVAIGAAGVGLGISASLGPAVALLGAAGLACGLLYDLLPRRWGLGWLCFVPAFPLLLAWTWVAASSELPPAWPLLLGIAAVAGPMIHLANGLVDVEADASVGRPGLAVRLGRPRGWQVLATLAAVVHGLAWTTLLTQPSAPLATEVVVLGLVGTSLGVVGLAGSASDDARLREAGWLSSAAGLGALGVALVAGLDA